MSQVITLYTKTGGKLPHEVRFPDVWTRSKPVTVAYSLELAEWYLYQQGYDIPGFDWIGPSWKPESRYLTQDEYPLGTTCWFVQVHLPHCQRTNCFGDDFKEAIWSAHIYIAETIKKLKEEEEKYARTK